MLIVIPEYFTLFSFLQVSLTCAIGIFAIATVVSGFYLVRLSGVWRVAMGVAGLLMVAPSWQSDIAALVIAAPVVLMQIRSLKSSIQSTDSRNRS